MKRLFVGNLPPTATEQSLQAVFSKFGTVRSIDLVKNLFSGDCKGIAFLEMEGHEARAAIAELDGKMFEVHKERLVFAAIDEIQNEIGVDIRAVAVVIGVQVLAVLYNRWMPIAARLRSRLALPRACPGDGLLCALGSGNAELHQTDFDGADVEDRSRRSAGRTGC